MKRILAIWILVLTVFSVSAQDAADMINQANEALKGKDYAKAFELYDKAMKNIGDVVVAESINYNIGLAAYKAEKYTESIPYLDKAIEASANVSKSHEYKAKAYSSLKDYANSVTSYEAAIETTEGGKGSLIYNAAITAYKGKLYEKAVSLFSNAIGEAYKANTATYYKAAVLKKLNKDAEYKQTLVEGAEKFPTDSKIASSLSKLYVTEGNGIYKNGVAILNAANEKVNSGALKTTDAAYDAEVDKAKVEFKAAADVLEKAAALDASNANAKKLLDACKQNLSL